MLLRPFRAAPPALLAACAALLAAPAFADVYIVDDDGGPGVDFTDLPAATAAAVPGDVLLVMPGSYSGFATSEGIAVLGQGDGVEVTSPTFLSNVPAGQVVRLVDLELTTLGLNGCSGVVVLDGITALGNASSPQALFVGDCADVRVIGSLASFSQAGSNGGHGLWTNAARVECVDSTLHGRSGTNGFGAGDSGSGGSGARIVAGSRVHLVLSESIGGSGGPGSVLCFPIFFGGNGGDGARLESSTLFAMGEPSVSKITAGAGGAGNPNCSQGFPGFALRLLTSSYVRHTGQSISGTVSVDGTSTLETPALLDPYMERFGTTLAGTQVRFNVFGEAGDEVTLFLGRNAVVQPLPGVLIEKLTSEERAFALGPIPAGGFATFVFPLPPWMKPGFTFYGQARAIRGAEEFRTNSIPVVVR